MFYFSAYNPSRKYNAYNTFSVRTELIHWQDWNGSDLVFTSKPYDDMFGHKSYVVKHDGVVFQFFFFFNDTATTEIYTLSLHDALPISQEVPVAKEIPQAIAKNIAGKSQVRSEEHTSELQSPDHLVCRLLLEKKKK